MNYYIVGIDGRQTPDPRYWFDRWECIQADTEEQAIEKWFEEKALWVRSEEKRYVKVWGVVDEPVHVWTWIIQNGFWKQED